MDFCLLLKIRTKTLAVKALAVNTGRNLLIMTNYLLQMYLKLLQKEQFKRLQTSANGYDKEIPRERYISLEERQKIINTRNQPPKFSTRN